MRRRSAISPPVVALVLVLGACTGAPEPVVAPATLAAPTTGMNSAPDITGSTVGSQPQQSSATSTVAKSAAPSTGAETVTTDTADSTGASTSTTAPGRSSEPRTGSTSSTVPLVDQPLVGSFVVEILSTRPHDPAAYTQGLEVHEAELLESTGRRGESDRRRVDSTTGQVTASVDLPDNLFGEGLTVVNGSIYQLTLSSGRVFVADPNSMEATRELAIDTEGWGICFDGSHVITSDGTSNLVFRDPATLAATRIVTVRLNGEPIRWLNELECDGGQILANIYGLDQLIAIDPSDGNVQAVIDASALRPADLPITDLNYALNGIAALPGTDGYYLTGKWWPVLYEVRFVPVG